jgi:hypothetical protein
MKREGGLRIEVSSEGTKSRAKGDGRRKRKFES